MAQIEEAEAYS